MLTLSDGSVLDVSAYPLPDDVSEDVMNRGQIAHALNVSEPTITSWINDGMPVRSKGGNGQAYEFQPSHCYAWRMHRLHGEQQARAAADGSAAKMRLLFQNLDDDQAVDEASWTPRQIKEAAEADYHRSRAGELRGELVRRDRVVRLIEGMLTTTRQTVMTLPDYAEQEFGLSARQSEQMQIRCEDLLVELRNELSRAALVAPEAGLSDLDQARMERLL